MKFPSRYQHFLTTTFFLEILEFASVQEETQGEEVDGEENGENTEGSGRNTTQVQRKSLMELLVMSIPVNLVLCLQCPIFYYLSLDIPILLISIVPTQSRNILIIFLSHLGQRLYRHY